MSDEAVKKQVEGTCVEISEKNGWTTFNIDAGRQYPERLSTKLPALIEQGRAAGQQKAVWTYSESEGGDNPNRPGQKYINRRLEKVEVGGQLDMNLAAATSSRSSGGGAASAGGARTADERVSIERQSLVKAAVAALPHEKLETVDDWFSFLDRLDDWMGRSRAGSAPASTPAATPPAEPAAPPAAEQPPADDHPPQHDDSDIPF